MKIKGLLFISCLAAGALIASPAFSRPAKKSVGHSSSLRMAARTKQVKPSYRYHQGRQNVSSRMGAPRYHSGMRYTGTRAYAGRQYSGSRAYAGRQYSGRGYYSGARQYRGNTYYTGNGYYGGSYPYYSYYSGWPYSNWGFGTSWGYPYSYWSGYPYSSWSGYPYGYYNNYYSYYRGYNGSAVAAVQRRLGQLGYYRGAVDGIAGPRTRSAIAGFESRNGLVVDGRISQPLLNRLGLA